MLGNFRENLLNIFVALDPDATQILLRKGQKYLVVDFLLHERADVLPEVQIAEDVIHRNSMLKLALGQWCSYYEHGPASFLCRHDRRSASGS